MLDLFWRHLEPGGQLSGITGHQIAVNNVSAMLRGAMCSLCGAQRQRRKREVIAWTAPPAAIQLKAFPRTRCPRSTRSTVECRQLISFRATLSDTGPQAGVACA